ncbi:TniB family NTP-binding protein [Paraburkholderia phenoliruptrix]|uniref:TniB family NTP-binding protein n=1 Tax=Paraburkholderia phenoliruptrix TaxID=252970 RepID=A0ABV3WLN6_9BURK
MPLRCGPAPSEQVKSDTRTRVGLLFRWSNSGQLCEMLSVHGDSNIGKTKITGKFRRAHPSEFDETTGVERCPVVSIQMPPSPDQHRC